MNVGQRAPDPRMGLVLAMVTPVTIGSSVAQVCSGHYRGLGWFGGAVEQSAHAQ